MFGVEENFAAGIERLGGLGGAIEEARRGADGLERIAGEEDVAGTGGERGFGVGAQHFAAGRGEDEAYGFFAGVGGGQEEFAGGKTASGTSTRDAAIAACPMPGGSCGDTLFEVVGLADLVRHQRGCRV